MVRRITEAITILSLVIIAGAVLFGGAYFSIQQSGGQWPAWIGNILTAFSGGILALLGTLFASRVNREMEKRRIEREQAAIYIRPYREFLIELYQLLSRKVYSKDENNDFLSKKLQLTTKEIDDCLKKMPPLAKAYLVYDQKFQEDVEKAVKDGVKLLESDVDDMFRKIFETWSISSREIIKKLNELESRSYS
jgi:hypothetical protein